MKNKNFKVFFSSCLSLLAVSIFASSVFVFSTPKVEASFIGDTVEVVSSFFSEIGDSLSAFFGKVADFGGANLFGGDTETGDPVPDTTETSEYTDSGEVVGGEIVPDGVIQGTGSFAVSAVDGYRAVKLNWASVPSATGYKITRYKILTSCSVVNPLQGEDTASIFDNLIPSASAEDCEETVIVSNITGNTHTDNNGLTNGVQYKYVIQALPTTLGKTATVSPVVPRLRAPDGVTALVFGTTGNQAKVSWENVPGVTTYNLTRYKIANSCDDGNEIENGEDAAFKYNLFKQIVLTANAADCEGTVISNITTNTYTDSNVTLGVKYVYVIASSADGVLSVTSRSNELLVGLYPPRNLNVQAKATGVLLTWTPINNNVVQGYKVFKTISSDFTQWSTPLTVTGGAMASSLNWDQTAGSSYKFKIVSYNTGSGDSVESTISPIVVAGLITPENINATAGSGKTTLNWNTVLPGQSTTYLVKRLKWQDCGTVQSLRERAFDLLIPNAYGAFDYCNDESFYGGAGTIVSTNTLNDSTGLDIGTKYKYTVVSRISGQSSGEGNSNEVVAGLVPPTNVTSSIVTNGVSLTWPAVSGATGYKVTRFKVLNSCGTVQAGDEEANLPESLINKLLPKANAADCEETVVAANVTNTSYIDTNTVNGSVYKYKITTLMGVNSSTFSNFSSQATAGLLPPTTVTVAINTSGVSVSWPVVQAATGYKVTRFKVLSSCGTAQAGDEEASLPESLINKLLPKASAADCEETIVATNVATNSFNDLTVTNGSQYKYKVATLMGGDTSVVSNFSAPVIAGLIAPASVTTSVATSGVSLTWPVVQAATGYKVTRFKVLSSCGTVQAGDEEANLPESLINKLLPKANAADCEETVVAANVTTNSFIDTTALSANQYKYRVQSLIGAEVSSPSALSAVVTAGLRSPSTVTANVVATGVNITWPAVSGATGYKVTRVKVLSSCGTVQAGDEEASLPESIINKLLPKANAADCEETVVAANITTASYTDTTVVNGSQYKYSVVTLMGSNTSTNPVISAVISPAIGLIAPTAIQGVVTPSGIKVTWTPVTLAGGGYVLERKTGEEAYAPITTINTVSTSSYFDSTGLVLGNKYSYRIKTTFEQASSEYKETANLANGALRHGLYAPVSLFATPDYSTGFINLAWPAITNNVVTGYVLEKSVGVSQNGTFVYNNYAQIAEIDLANTANFVDEEVATGTHYRYRIKSVRKTATAPDGGENNGNELAD